MKIDQLLKNNKNFKDIHFSKLEDKFDNLVVNWQKTLKAKCNG